MVAGAGRGPVLHAEVLPGNGPFLLLVHGILSSRAQWAPNLEALARVSRPVVVELWGHGRSPAPSEPAAYAPAAYVAQFEELRRRLEAERWFACGASLGAALTLRYALDHPERLLAQVLTNSSSALAEPGWAERIGPEVEASARALEEGGRAAVVAHRLNPGRTRRLPDELRRALAADAASHDPAGVARSFRHTVPASALAGRLGENRVPALLVAGRRERAFAPARRRAEAALAHLEVVEVDAGHAVNLDDPAAFDAAVTAFLARHVTGGATG